MKRTSLTPHEMEHAALLFIRAMFVLAILAIAVGAVA